MMSDEQKQICKWISEVLQLPYHANVFEGAVNILKTKPAGYGLFVAHAGRDLMNRLVRDFRGDKSKKVDYPALVNKISEFWDYPQTNTFDIESKPFEIKQPLRDKIDDLVRKHNEGTKRSEKTRYLFFSEFFDYEDKDSVPKNIAIDWKNLKNFFDNYAHIGKDMGNVEFDKNIKSNFEKLQHYFKIASESQYRLVRKLDEILEDANS